MASPAPEIAAALRRLPGFGDLDAEDLASLTEGASPLRAAPGQTLMRRGDPGGNLMVLLEGRLRVSTVSAEGRPLAFRLVEPVECVGEIGCLDGQPRTADVAVLAPSRLLVLPRGACLAALAARPAVARALIGLLCQRLRDTSAGLERVATQRLPARIAHLLLRLAADYGRAGAGGAILLPMRLPQGEIATLVAASREAVNKQLRQWHEAGGLRLSGGRIEILRPEVLRAEAEAP